MNLRKVVETGITLRFEVERLLENCPDYRVQKLINDWDIAFNEKESTHVR